VTVARACWCGASDARPLARPAIPEWGGETITLVRCRGCGVLALHPQPNDVKLRLAYAAEYYGASPRKFVGPVARLVEWFQDGRARSVARHAPRGGRVLDIGCGNGGFLAGIARLGLAAEGTEWTAESARRASGHPGVTVHVGELGALALPAGRYDAVTLWHVLEHVRDPAATLAEARRLLRPGGRLHVSMPNAASWQARRFGADWFHLDPPRHLCLFGTGNFERLLRRRGFAVEARSTWSLEQNPYGIIQSVLNAAGLPRNLAYEVLKGTARDAGAPTKAAQLALVGLLAGPSLAMALLETAAGRGGTMTIRARTRGPQ
jgi:SAM-dependent methyltransferase